MTSKQRIEAFVQLGNFLKQFAVDKPWEGYQNGVSQADYDEFNAVIAGVQAHNGWFTAPMVRKAIGGICTWLKTDVLAQWLATYPAEPAKPKTIAVIMAGNIPLVGFHDALCVLISGHRLMAKFSSDDNVLVPLVLKYLVQIEPALNDYIRVANDKMTGFDAVIATGSNNSARYFEYYFGKYPHIIRKNRTSVALLTGNETKEQLEQLGHDIFDFYGLGCRNVTKLYVPRNYNLDDFFGGIFGFKDIINHHKYANNYDYHKAIYLMNQDKLVENGFIMLKEEDALFSPVGVLHYAYYDSRDAVEAELAEKQNDIQCVVGKGHIAFGAAQQPGISDYADGVDTMQFLATL